MISLLRSSVIVSLLAMLAVALLPLDRPHEATFPIDHPPALPLLAALSGLLVISLQAISAYGLLRFRRWSPAAAAATAALVAGFAIALILAPDRGLAVSMTAKAMALVSAVALALAVLLARTRELKKRFDVARS